MLIGRPVCCSVVIASFVCVAACGDGGTPSPMSTAGASAAGTPSMAGAMSGAGTTSGGGAGGAAGNATAGGGAGTVAGGGAGGLAGGGGSAGAAMMPVLPVLRDGAYGFDMGDV